MIQQHIKLWLTYWWRTWRQQYLIDDLLDELGKLRRESGTLQTRLILTGRALIKAKERLGQKFPEGYK